MPGPSWYGVTTSQAGNGFFTSVTAAQPRSELLVSTSAREALAERVRCFFFVFFHSVWIFVPYYAEEFNLILLRDHVMRYRIDRLLNALESDGKPSFSKGLNAFCFER